MNWTAIWVTFKLACLTAGVLLVVGLPIAYWLTFSRRAVVDGLNAAVLEKKMKKEQEKRKK